MVTTIEYLLAFPPDGNTTDKVYDKAARNHVKTITGFLTDQGFTTKATSGELFQVPSYASPPSPRRSLPFTQKVTMNHPADPGPLDQLHLLSCGSSLDQKNQ